MIQNFISFHTVYNFKDRLTLQIIHKVIFAFGIHILSLLGLRAEKKGSQVSGSYITSENKQIYVIGIFRGYICWIMDIPSTIDQLEFQVVCLKKVNFF